MRLNRRVFASIDSVFCLSSTNMKKNTGVSSSQGENKLLEKEIDQTNNPDPLHGCGGICVHCENDFFIIIPNSF